MSLRLRKNDPKELSLYINSHSPEGGLFEGDRTYLHPDSRLPWRISPEPFWLTNTQLRFFEDLGPLLLRFYTASNLLYHQSVKGIRPAWVHEYLDMGKPERVINLGRMNRFRTQLPSVMRPDLLLTENGFRVTELDSIPGGMGFTGHIAGVYSDLGYNVIGGGDGLVTGFYEACLNASNSESPTVVILVSDESDNYREEMSWLAGQLTLRNCPVFCRHPKEIRFDENGLLVDDGGNCRRVDAVYRFFEMFDLPNIPKIELVTYFAKKNAIKLTPPPKAFLEEKLWLALLHHPLLQEYWELELGREDTMLLQEIVPYTWILDNRPLPPHAIMPALTVGNQAVNNWNQLDNLSKRQRELVIKPSGFSENASQSRDVAIGHDMPEGEWQDRLQTALSRFPNSPYILQEFHKSSQVRMQYYDFDRGETRPMRGRVLLRPYYYIVDSEPRLAGVQALVCPPDKKLLHGMSDAILAPCATIDEDNATVPAVEN